MGRRVPLHWHGGGIVPAHAHYAIQIASGSGPGIRFGAGEWDAWTEYAGAMIPSRHQYTTRV